MVGILMLDLLNFLLAEHGALAETAKAVASIGASASLDELLREQVAQEIQRRSVCIAAGTAAAVLTVIAVGMMVSGWGVAVVMVATAVMMIRGRESVHCCLI